MNPSDVNTCSAEVLNILPKRCVEMLQSLKNHHLNLEMLKFKNICIAVFVSLHGELLSTFCHTSHAVCGTSFVCSSLFKPSQKSNSPCIDFRVSFITAVSEGFTTTN